MFQLGHICLQQASLLQEYTSCMYGLSGGGVLVLNQERTASFARQDSNNIEQDGICNQQAVDIHYRMVSRWVEPRSGYRVMEGREISNIQPILTDCVNIAPDPPKIPPLSVKSLTIKPISLRVT